VPAAGCHQKPIRTPYMPRLERREGAACCTRRLELFGAGAGHQVRPRAREELKAVLSALAKDGREQGHRVIHGHATPTLTLAG